jgi:predicted glycoside hydrolase/deacetylase ChbG (UPF0249 family)
LTGRPKRLVVTVDDVGLAPGMTDGALLAADRGLATAVSVAAVGEDVERAAALLRARPRLDVGAHLVLVGERPLSSPAEVPSLLGPDGALLSDFRAFLRRYLGGGVDLGEVEVELDLQLARLRDLGLRVVHLNSHQHLHVLPRLFGVVLRLARRHGVPFVRIPRDPAPARSFSPRAWTLRGLNLLGGRARRRLPAGVAALARTLGLLDAGHLTAERLLRLFADVEGSCELVCHAGLGQASLAARYAWGYAWESETAALCDPRAPRCLADAGIELTSFRDLESGGIR